MQILTKLHTELLALEARMHDLVDPEKYIADKVRELVKEGVAEITKLRTEFNALAARVEEIAGHPALSVPPLSVQPAAPAVPPSPQAADSGAATAGNPVVDPSPESAPAAPETTTSSAPAGSEAQAGADASPGT